MKAAILNESSKSLIIDDIDLPNKLEIGQVLVKLKYSGICGAQINEIDALKGPDKFLPHLLGHEGTGKIIDIGPNVKKLTINDNVVLHWRKGSGIESKTPTYFLGNSHGFNSVHGRMPSVATGANLANRDLIYVGVSGDGDSASIGMGQFTHAERRNVHMLYVVENNGCYGLT